METPTNTIDMATEPVKVVDINEKQEVQYCIPDWLRDEQIRINIAHVKGRITAPDPAYTGSIACVNFGPSLNKTWEELKNFKYIITCSGAYKFLMDRGIVPTWHLDVDPRAHKIDLIGDKIDPRTDFLIASTCHPDLIKHIESNGGTVRLWHIYDSTEAGLRLLPHGEWALTGSCSAGGRTLTLARFLGFTDLHIFGMDGNIDDEYGSHAAEHPKANKKYIQTEYKGRVFKTTPGMLEAAKGVFHELDVLRDTNVTFYGDGLVQEMAKDYVRKDNQSPYIGILKQPTITPEYVEQNKLLHNSKLEYGVGGGKHADTVKKLYKIVQKETEFPSVLDYGCGKGYLGKELGFPIFEYDPAIPGKEATPPAADICVCTDVLEHIEPDLLEHVLADLCRCTRQVGFFTINTGPAMKTLPDGRNTHLIQQDKAWWTERLEKFFVIGKTEERGSDIYVVVSPKFKKAPQAFVPAKAAKVNDEPVIHVNADA